MLYHEQTDHQNKSPTELKTSYIIYMYVHIIQNVL